MEASPSFAGTVEPLPLSPTSDYSSDIVGAVLNDLP
jgi:hypothetical protein